jgi:amino acid transporter
MTCDPIVLPTEMSASAVLINYWITSVNNSVWIIIALLVVISINSCGSKLYGEFEFWSVVIRYDIAS